MDTILWVGGGGGGRGEEEEEEMRLASMAERRGVASLWRGEEEEEEGWGEAWLVSWEGRRGEGEEEGLGWEERRFLSAEEEEEEEEGSSSRMTLEGEARFSLSRREARRIEERRLPTAGTGASSSTSSIIWVAFTSSSSCLLYSNLKERSATTKTSPWASVVVLPLAPVRGWPLTKVGLTSE